MQVRRRRDDEVLGPGGLTGTTRIHCLFCHGFEERGADSVGVVATGLLTEPEMIKHVAPMAARLSKHVNIYTDGNAGVLASLKDAFHSSKIVLDARVVTSFRLLDGGPAVEETFADGSTRTEGWIVSHPNVEQAAPFASQLGLEMGPMATIRVKKPTQETSVEGCFAAGDAATPMRSVPLAVQTGVLAGTGLVAQLQTKLEAEDKL